MSVRRPSVLIFASFAVGVAWLAVALHNGLIWGAVLGLVLLICAAVLAAVRLGGGDPDVGRRQFLAVAGLAGATAVLGGDALGWAFRRLTRPDPAPALRGMAQNVGAEGLDLILRDYRPGRSGDLQLVLTPGSTANYAGESKSLLHRDPRSSHALPWLYLERVPLVIWSGNALAPGDHAGRVTLADVAPTIASMIGFDGYRAADGRPLPGTPAFSTRPKVVVTFVIDGGGWNVLQHWGDAWPNVKRLMREGVVYRNAITGSSPAVTACAHATIGTGAFPRTHGITGHNIRDGRSVRKAYGTIGKADPSDILVPTLADEWVKANDGNAWVGEIGYQIWHLGMLGRGGRPLGQSPVAVYWDDDVTSTWQPQNPDLYRLPKEVPATSMLEQAQSSYQDPHIDDEYARFLTPKTDVCCSPPIIQYEGDVIEATIRSEQLGTHGATDLLFINFKAPDYTGHVYNMLSERERIALAAVDEEIGRLAKNLLDTYGAGNFAFIVTADHGQCPTVDTMGGVRVDPIQLKADIEAQFGRSPFDLVQSVVPSEIYLDDRALLDLGVTRDDIAAWLRDYRYRDNIGPYIKQDAIEHGHLNEPAFAAVLSTDFLDRLRGADLNAYGDGRMWADADVTGVPPVTW
ncbi:MAG: alkaline phosphatase family protein [Actinomycetota bacterium]